MRAQSRLERLLGKLEPTGKYATMIVRDVGRPEVHLAFEHQGDARNVVLDKSYGAPRITKDGVTVAKEIELSDKLESIGAASWCARWQTRTSDSAGDGTTTATVLAQAIVREGAKSVAAGMNPMDLRRGIDLAAEMVIEELRDRSKKVSTSEEIAQVGTVSANGDSAIGDMIAKAMDKVGKDGVITVETNQTHLV